MVKTPAQLDELLDWPPADDDAADAVSLDGGDAGGAVASPDCPRSPATGDDDDDDATAAGGDAGGPEEAFTPAVCLNPKAEKEAEKAAEKAAGAAPGSGAEAAALGGNGSGFAPGMWVVK